MLIKINHLAHIVFTKPLSAVILSVIVGPVAIVLTNNHIQNKQIQRDVITKVVETASSADFTKMQSLEKIGIIAHLVDENQKIFGLHFDRTMERVDDLKLSGSGKLQTEIREVGSQMNLLGAKLKDDSLQMVQLRRERNLLNEELGRLNGETRMDKVRLQAQYDTLQHQKELHEISIRTLESTVEVNQERMLLLREKNDRLLEDLEVSNQRILDLQLSRNRYEEQLEASRKLIDLKDADIGMLKRSLEDLSESFEEMLKKQEMEVITQTQLSSN